jgi:hypothetical protein
MLLGRGEKVAEGKWERERERGERVGGWVGSLVCCIAPG